MPTITVLVNLKEGASPEEYERWVVESYAPAVWRLPSVADWRNHRVSGLLGSDAAPPYRYVVTVEIDDLEQLGRDMEGGGRQRALSEDRRVPEVKATLSERFA